MGTVPIFRPTSCRILPRHHGMRRWRYPRCSRTFRLRHHSSGPKPLVKSAEKGEHVRISKRPSVWEALDAYTKYVREAGELLGEQIPKVDRKTFAEVYLNQGDKECTEWVSTLRRGFRRNVHATAALARKIFQKIEDGCPPPPEIQADLQAFEEYRRKQE